MDSAAAYLLKDQVLPTGQDYSQLRAEGLAHLRQLCGASWTDYNEHDPGVTLLEALCYLLTEVSHRADQPVPALLAAAPAASAAPVVGSPKRAFAPPPATLPDYEQLVRDKLPKLVKSIILEPLNALLPGAGLYRALVEAYPPPLSGLTTDEHKLQTEVLRVLNFHRNLGDVFVEVVVRKPRPVAVGGHLALGAGQAPVPVLTNLLLELGYQLPYLSPAGASPAKRLPFFRAHVPGGPEPHSLYAAQHTGTHLKYAGKTAGIHTIQGLRLHPLDDPHGTLGPDEVPVLDPTQTLAYLTVTQQGLLLSFDYRQVLQAYYAQVRYTEAQALTLPFTQLQPLAGNPQPHDYGSIQDLLPMIYGVGTAGPPTASSQRVAPFANAAFTADSLTARACIMQLKGYMLLFDQLLANFCAQLEHVGDYFSPGQRPPASPFGLLYEVPYVAPLLPGTAVLPDDAWHYTTQAVNAWQSYQADPENQYVRALKSLAATSGPTASSREDFLKHLLARFGYAAMPLPTSYASAAAETATLTVDTYERLLSHLETATYHRAAARLPGRAEEAPAHQHAYAESGLEFFLYLLTGLEPLARKWARHQRLTDLEAQLQPGEGPAPGGAPRLVVRGPVTDFAPVVEELADQLHQPDDEEEAAGFRQPGAGYLELSGLPGGPAAHPPLLRAHLGQWAARFERFCLLDHAVLRPGPAAAGSVEDDFYHCQATVLLPGYAARFRHHGPRKGPHDARNRQLVEGFLTQYAPAHLLLNVLWLDYRAMRHWESLYAALAHASGLLNPRGHSHHEALREAQHHARHFLERHLHPVVS